VRYIKSFALGIAVASRGADHLRNRPTFDILRIPDDLRDKLYGFPTNSDPTSYESKAGMVAWHDDIFAVADSLGICKFITHGFNSPKLLGYDHFLELIQSIEGIRFGEDELRGVGKRVIDIERQINLEVGRTRADDTLPKRYFDDPMPARVTKGHHIDRGKFQTMLDEYYEVRGWNHEGHLSKERLAELDGLM
jgi:aldehyde:ferredoxin oxidoreductase